MARHEYRAGLVGNCAYNALVAENTEVLWMCLPRFDASFLFGSLLDVKKGGRFSVQPEEGNKEGGKKKTRYQQAYIEHTNVLETTVRAEGGCYQVTDFAPRFRLYDRHFKPLMFVRILRPVEGFVRIKVRCEPVGDYGERQLSSSHGSNHVRYHGLDDALRLTTNIPLLYITEQQNFVLEETKYLVLTYGLPLEAPLEETANHFLKKTIDYWTGWVRHISVPRLYQSAFIRSALVLKLHQYEDTGAVIASASMGLPEAPATPRTWDYRYCWIRDAHYTMKVFESIGHFEELERYFTYVLNLKREHGRYRPLYRISGEVLEGEKELPLSGYMNYGPVRLGNQATEHIQNDVYGQVLLALLPLYTDERFKQHYRRMPQGLVEDLLSSIERTLDEEDAGLWEFRQQKGLYCYTQLFHWAGAHAVQQMATVLKLNPLIRRAQRIQIAATKHIESCYVPEKGGYGRHPNDPRMDASTLQLITMGYLTDDRKKARAHLATIERELHAGKGLFYRYRHADDFGTPKTTFLVCAFWYAEALACLGMLDEARSHVEQLLGYANLHGLFSEDVDVTDGSQWGNFPQVYSHVGLLSALIRIDGLLQGPRFLSL